MDVAISAVATLLVMSTLLALAGRSKPREGKQGVVLVYSAAAKAVAGVFSLGGTVALGGLALLPHNQSTGALVNGAIAFAIVVIPAGWCFCEALRRRILLSRAAILEIGRNGRRRRIRWSDVTSVTYSNMLGCYFVERRDGSRISVSQLLVGQREFARLVLEHVAEKHIACISALRNAAADS